MQQRQQNILDELAHRERCSYAELAHRLRVSTMTIRRDVQALEQRGALIKTLGGARRAQDPGSSLLHETTLASRVDLQIGEKRAIAKKALETIGNRQTLFLDGGTTCLELAASIAASRRGLTVVTNSAVVAIKAGGNGANAVVLLGGQLDPVSACLVGSATEEAAAAYFVEVAFFSTKGFRVEEGTFESSVPTIRVKQTVARQAGEIILLVDHTKFGQRALSKVIDISRISGVVTDDAAPAADLAILREKGTKIWIANPMRQVNPEAPGGHRVP